MKLKTELYPNYTAIIEAIRNGGITPTLLAKIIDKHTFNAIKTKDMYDRYRTMDTAVPIFTRKARFNESSEENSSQINNKVNNDFFSEIVDIKVGYFAGNPVAYGYCDTDESVNMTGGEEAVELAKKAVSDFTVRNNMYDIDMEATKLATICGYAGRLLYIDENGEPRVMVTMPFETVILYEKDMTEPLYAVRYFQLEDINDSDYFHVEFYDEKYRYIYEGATTADLRLISKTPHMFSGCPLQGIPNNFEYMGDCEKTLELIDAYDRSVSDSNNEIESFANAYMVFENINISDEEIANAQKTGAIKFYSGSGTGKVYFLVKNIDDGFIEHHLDRLEDNIYRFSKTPNLGDESFGNATGVALKFKITGLETKCGMFEAKMKSAGTYMFKLLAGVWSLTKQIAFDPLQCTMDFKRNFPLDLTSEAQACATLIGSGLPKEVAFAQLSFVDDVNYIMQLIEEEQAGIPSLLEDTDKEADEENPDNEENMDEDTDDNDNTEGEEK